MPLPPPLNGTVIKIFFEIVLKTPPLDCIFQQWGWGRDETRTCRDP